MSDYRRIAIVVILLAAAMMPEVSGRGEALASAISGRITDADTGLPLYGANVVIVGTQRGAMSDMNGEFLVSDLPPGTYVLKILMMGYKVVEIPSFVLQSGENRTVGVELQAAFYEAPEGDIVGSDIVTRDSVECRIQAAWPFSVGDQPIFDVIFANRSSEVLYLLRPRVGCAYPKVYVSISGPMDESRSVDYARCGIRQPSMESSVISLPPGQQVTTRRWELDCGRFAKPGTYVVVFRYFSEERGIEAWASTSPSRQFVDVLRSVPAVALACTTSFEVLEGR